MRIIITGFQPGKKIQAIKAIRSVSSVALGLKEAKGIADDVEAGTASFIEVEPGRAHELEEWGVMWASISTEVTLTDLIEALNRFPKATTVGDLLAILIPARDFQMSDRKDQK